MTNSSYYSPPGGLPPQTQLMTDRAVFTDAYAVITKGTLRDITKSGLPFWEKAEAWILSRPLSGFSETFSQYIMDVAPGGGSDKPELDPDAQGALFVVKGSVTVTIEGDEHVLEEGGFAYLPPKCNWTLRNTSDASASFHWIRKAYEWVEGIDAPKAFTSSDQDVALSAMPDTDGRWATTRFIDPSDISHDMNVNIVTLEPGAVIPFMETHVMEHGLYVLEGKAVYRLNQDWVEV
ncbi:MAG: (S)-ureidoglycine aminohydrolase, partial [Rhodobacteraceae bacterium]|nr:(S)-ureidoglycine aminohydrolase [Paracoccaceae bacterium]